MSSPFQRAFSSKSPLNSNHGNENSRQFGGYDPDSGEVINALTGKTQSQQNAANKLEMAKQLRFPDEYGAYQEAQTAHQDLDPFMTDPDEYDASRARVDSLHNIYDKLVLPTTNDTDIPLDN